jgi:hypothetical protein
MRPFATAAGAFALVLAVLLAAVGQLGKIDGQTLVAVTVAAAVFALVAGLRASRSERQRERGDAPPRPRGPSEPQP